MKTRFLAVLLIVSCLFVGSDKNYACINDPPNVSITYPYNGTIFAEDDNILICASASDSDGSVTKVEFYQGSTKLGEDTDAPYSYIWNFNVYAGSYNLTAKAFDNDGATTISEAVGITVTDIWYVDADVMYGNGQSWLGAFNSLQDALKSANPGDEIRVAEGIYKPDLGVGITIGDRGASFELVDGVSIYGGFAGYAPMPPPPPAPPQPPPPDPDTRDITKYKTVLSGDIDDDDLENGMPDKENSYHVVTGAYGAVLDGFTITRGYADDDAGFGGGGLFNNNGNPVMLNCIFEYNVATGNQHGGAVYNSNGSNLQLINCLLIGNMGRGNSGGAIYNNGGTLWMNNCTVANNAGDGIHCDSAALVMYNSIIWHNRADVDDSAYPVREICLFNTAQAHISYSNIEGGQADVIQEGTPVLNWGAGNASGTEEPQFVQSGTWKWKLADGNDVVQGTPLIANSSEITIFDFQDGFSDMSVNENHDEDEFVADFLCTDSGNYYKTPQMMDKPINTSTITRTGSGTDDYWKFKLWYAPDPYENKRGPVNTNLQVPKRYCIDPVKGVFELNSDHFFPIDTCCDDCGSDCDCADPPCFGREDQPKCYCSECGVYHNYFFTLKYSTKFTYVPGQTFEFEASDDIIVAINDRVILSREGFFVDCNSHSIIELTGGIAYVSTSSPYPIYPQQEWCQGVMEDLVPIDLGLEPYKVYDLDLFYANRNVPKSVLKVQWTPGDSEMVASFEPGDYHLQPGSPCIDAGDNSKVPYNVPTDLDGNPRRIDDPDTDPDPGYGTPPVVDMGADEYNPLSVNAGIDQVIALPTVTANLDGTVTGGIPGRVTTSWSQDSGPGDVQFEDSTMVDTTATFPQTGIYILKLTAEDGFSTKEDTVEIIVHEAPTVDAGVDQIITLPTNSVNLDGTVTDDGLPNPQISITWLPVSGPGPVNFEPENLEDTTATFSQSGVYVLRLLADDGAVVVSDTVTITVNEAPTVQIEAVQPITLPTNFVDMNGTVTDDGLPNPPGEVTLIWSQESGPGTVTWDPSPPDVPNPRATFDQAGVYVLKLQADDGVAVVTATVEITVADHVPVADAGPDQNLSACITDEYISVTLDGSGSTDEGDDIVDYLWTEAGATIATGEIVDVLMSVSDSPHDVTLTVTDSIEDSDTDTVQIRIVVQAPEAVPGNYFEEADGGAGADVTLDGSNSTGVGLTYIWYAGGNEIARGPNPTVRFAVGTHTIGLLVIDECGSSDYAEGEVTVSWSSLGAEIDAGEPQQICLPFDGTEQLHGSKIDPGNEIVNYEWKVIGVPEGGYIANWPDGTAILNPRVTLADGIVGKYTFQLIGRDDDPVDPHEIDSDTTSITVNSCGGYNIRPEVRAWILDGSEEVIEHIIASTATTVELRGTITDDGQISGVLTGTWDKIDGPLNGVQISPLTESCGDHCTNLEVTATATFNQEGIYQLALIGDDGTLSDTDVVVVQCGNLLPEVWAGENKTATLVEDGGIYRATVPLHDAIATERTMPRNMTLFWSATPPAGVTVKFVDASGVQSPGEQNPTVIFEGSDPAVITAQPYQLILTATDPDFPPPNNNDDDDVWITIVPDDSEQTFVYAITDMVRGNFGRFKWDSSTNSLSEEEDSPGIEYAAVGLALDPEQHYLFITQEYQAGYDDIYVFDALDLSTMVSSVADFPGTDLSGITTDSERQLIYVADRGKENLYIYSWDVDTLTLNLENGGNPVILKNLAQQSIKTGGLAYDEKDGYLYVTEISGHSPVSSKVYCYDVETWECEYEFDTGKYAVAVAVHNDGIGTKYLYTGTYTYLYPTDGYYIVRTDISNPLSPVSVTKDLSASAEQAWALAIDNTTGLLFTVTSDDYIKVYDGLAQDQDWETAVPTYSEKFSPLHGMSDIVVAAPTKVLGTVEMTLDSINGVPPAPEPSAGLYDSILCSVEYTIDAGISESDDTIVICQLPDGVTFVSASHQGIYDEGRNSILWYLGKVIANQTNENEEDLFKFEVKVNDFSIPGAENLVLRSRMRSADGCAFADPLKINISDWIVDIKPKILYVDDNSKGYSGISWDKAFSDLKDALVAINTFPTRYSSVKQIWVAAGTYFPRDEAYYAFMMINGVSVYGGFKGIESSREERDLSDPANETILRGLSKVDYVIATADNTVLDGFTITGGNSAGVLCYDATSSIISTISNCVIKNNGYGGYGVGIGIWDVGNPFTITIKNNTIRDNLWHGISWYAPNDNSDTSNVLDISNNTIYDNSTWDGICLDKYNGTVYIYNNFTYENARYGISLSSCEVAAGICNNFIHENGKYGIFVNNCVIGAVIRNNTIADNLEYGIYNNSSGADLYVYNCLLWGNYGGQTGGQQSGCTPHNCYIDGSDYTKDNKDDNFNFGGANPFDSPDTYHLASNADCIDQGLNELAGIWTIAAYETDIDNEARLIGDFVDIGADEFSGIWVDAGDTIYEKIPAGASSVDVDFESAEIKYISGDDVPTQLSYQWSCIDYPSGYEPVFISDSDSELYASVTFNAEGWYMFLLEVTNQDDSTKKVGADLLYVRIDTGVEIVVADKDPVSGASDERTYQTNINDTLNLSANFGPPSPLPEHVQWWAPYEPVSIGTPMQVNTTISFDTPGLYPIELYAINAGNEVIGKDRIWIEVQFPMVEVSAGPDRTIYLEKIGEIWQVSDQFLGTVDGVVVTGSDRVEWSVEAADDIADLDSVLIVPDSLNPKSANITFGHYGAYYVVFRAWKNTSQGEVFLGAGAAVTIVTYQQVELSASADPLSISVDLAPATCNLHGELLEGQVDSVEWVFPYPDAPDGLVTFASPKSWNTMVSFNEVEVDEITYSGAGKYPIILLGKIRIGGEDRVVASATVEITVVVDDGIGDDFTRTICISPHYDEDEETNPPALPWLIDVWAEIEEGLCGSTTGTFEDYDYAVWSWSGSDNSVVINQPDLGVPMAKVLFNKAGSYILTLVVKNGGELIATTTMEVVVREETCIISAEAAFDPDMTEKVLENVAVGDTIDLYGQVQIQGDCIHSQTEYYWSCGGSSDAVDLDPVQTTDPDVQATVTFSEPGEYPLTLCVVNAQTQELLASETILAVVPPLFWLDISGPQFTVPGTSLTLNAKILGGAPDGSTCTWSNAQPENISPVQDQPVNSGDEVTYIFPSAGTYELTVTGNVNVGEYIWSQIADITVWVSEDLSEIGTKWCAGSTKYVTLPEPAHMSDAAFVTTEAGIVPKWSLVIGPADVTFLPDDNSETPYVVFYEPGEYKLSLVPWDVQAGEQKSGTEASEVYVFVFAPSVHNPDVPGVTLGIEDGTSDNLKVLTAKATDKDGVSYLMLKLGDETLADVSGDPAFYRELELVYELDISHLSDVPSGTSCFQAYAWDTIGYMGQSYEEVCANNSAIRDFKVSPETIDDDTVDDLTFTASFDEERNWELKIFKAGASSPVETHTSSVAELDLEDIIPLAETAAWANGNYYGELTVPVNGTNHKGKAHFRILRGQISSSDITAELDSFVGDSSGNISLINEWSFPDFALESDEIITNFDSPIQVIKDGRGVVSAKLGNPDFPYDTEYRLQVGTVYFDTFKNKYYFTPIQVITPFDVSHDAMGWAPTPWQPVESIGVNVIELGTVDLSMLENGTYYMELSVRCDGYDEPRNDYAQFILDCPLKIGNVKFSQEDLLIETGGIPLRVVRTYDSFKKDKDSEFGHGWAYSIANLDIELDETRLWMYEADFTWNGIQYDSPISTRYGGELTNRNVTLTLPDGRRTTFMFYLDYHRPDWSNSQFEFYTAEYMSMPGIDAELRAVGRSSNIAWWENGDPKEVCRVSLFENEQLYWEGVLGGSGEWESVTQADPSMYDFCSYVLKTGNGTEYYFERDTFTGDYFDGGEADWLCFYDGDSVLDAYYTIARGHPYLTRIKTADGEEINFNTNLHTGLIGANGYIECKDAQGNDTKSLQIMYYPVETPPVERRIWYINAPSEVNQDPVNGTPTLVYEYDDEGNLTKVKKLVNKNGATPEEQYDVIEYVYEDQTHDPADHYVTDIRDPRGLAPIRYFYDAAGRLTETVDAKGNHITIEHDVTGKVEMVYERWDTEKLYPTLYEYNERGNVTWTKRLKILPEGDPDVLEETEYVYVSNSTYPDSPRKIIKSVLGDPDNPIVTQYDYDKYGKTILTVDPEYNVTETFYYDDGNVKWVIQGKNFTGTVGEGILQPPYTSPPYEDGGYYDIISKTYNTYEGNKLKTTEVRDYTDTRLQMTVNIYDGLNRLVNTVQIDVQEMTPEDFQALYYLQDIADLPYSNKHSITSYSYNGDDLQPSYITNPAGSNTYFSYDDNGNQRASWYYWDYISNNDYVSNPKVIGYDSCVITLSEYDSQGRSVRTRRVVSVLSPENQENPTYPQPSDIDYLFLPGSDGEVLSETKYNSLGKADFTIDQYNNVTKYEYDQIGNLVETRTFTTADYDIGINSQGQIEEYDSDGTGTVVQTYNSFTAFETDADTSHLTTSRTLYDREGRVLITVGPYDPAVYNEGGSVSEWPVGTETVYDVLGRVVETRRWAGVKVDLTPFKVIKEQSQPAPCQPDDPDMVGKMVPLDVYPENAWDGTGDQPANIGWSSEGKLPVIIPGIAVDKIDDFVGPLSYSRTVYDDGGRVKHSVNLQEAIEDLDLGLDGGWVTVEQPTTYYYDMAGKQTIVIDPLGHDISSLSTEDIALYGYTPDEPVIAKYTDFTTFDDTEGTGNLTGTHKTVTEYDGTRRSAVTDARVNTTSFEYDALGRLEKTIHPLAKYYDDVDEYVTYSHLGYDGLGRKKWQTEATRENEIANLGDEDGLRWFDYDVAGRLTQVTLPRPKTADPYPVYKYIYDDYGNQVGILDSLNRLTVFEYDESNRKTAKYMPFAFVDPTPGDGEITVDDIYDAVGAASPGVEYWDYDLHGRLEAHTDYKEQTTGYFYNNLGPLQYKRYYNSDGTIDGINQNYETDPENNWAEQIEYTYDTLGRRKTVEEKNNPNTYTRTTTYHYDAQGRIVQIDTPHPQDQGTIYYTYDPITGRKTNTSTATGNTNTNYYYDELGRLAGTGTASENTYYHYDEVGNRKWLCVDVDGDFDYSDPAAPTGYEIKTDYTYDPLNRLTDLLQKKTAEAVLSSYIYTLKADGHRHSLVETLNETRNITYGYDYLNRLTDETATSSSNGYDIDYTYDLAGNRTQRQVTANGPTLTTTYDNLDTDKLYTETHSGPVYAVSLHENDRYYAYAAPNGGYFYRDTRGHTIGSFMAFFMGLPSVWSRYVFILAMALVPLLLFGPALLHLTKRYVLRHPIKVRLRVPKKGICLLVAFVMLLGPESFHNLSQADVQYANLNSASWANGDTTITYTYDDNGSVETKTTVTSSVVKEVVTYHYNLAGRLDKVTTDDQAGTEHIVEYIYNDEGIRVQAYSYDQPTGGGAKSNEKTVTYLVDSYNHTGYAQVLEEWAVEGGTATLTCYTLGDDVIAQKKSYWQWVDPQWELQSTGNTQYLLYDGHGSTRQLAEFDTEVTIADSFSYDGYGVLLQDKDNFPPAGTQVPGKVAQQATSLLYAGEHFDTDSQNYYLRARWYDSLSGRFNRMDPYAGNNQDPQSLHKYLYCHANPINGVDPTGLEWNISDTLMTIGLGISLIGLSIMGIGELTGIGIVSDIGAEILALGLAVFAAGGAAGIFALKTAAEAIVVACITTAITLVIRLTHHGVIQFSDKRLDPGGELWFLVSKMTSEGGLPRRGIIIYRGASTITRFRNKIEFRTGEPEYRIDDKVLRYSIDVKDNSTVVFSQYEIKNTDPLEKKMIVWPTEITVGATHSGIIDEYPGWKWTVIE